MGIEKLKSGSYKVVIGIKSKVKYLGCFATHEEAVDAYTKAKNNFPKHMRIDAKFTDSQCIDLLHSKLKVPELCEIHGVHFSTIYKAKNRAKKLIDKNT